jgi:hypothetical protein
MHVFCDSNLSVNLTNSFPLFLDKPPNVLHRKTGSASKNCRLILTPRHTSACYKWAADKAAADKAAAAAADKALHDLRTSRSGPQKSCQMKI